MHAATPSIDVDRAHLLHPLHHPSSYAASQTWVEGRGAIIKDPTGREYVDGLAGPWNVNVGHGRRELADAARDQMTTLAYYSSYSGSINYPAVALAEKLCDLVYPSINAFFFTSGGAEASETSFKTVRFYWKAEGKPDKVKAISRHHAYHGLTLAAMSATGLPAFWPMFEPRVPGFVHIEAPDPYRFVNDDPGVAVGVAAAQKLEDAILREGADTVAAFIAEPVQGAGGVIIPPADYFARVREICTKHDVLFIADEVITGFGRTGRWFGLERYRVEPDVMQFAKGITSGYIPLGGIGVSNAVRDVINGVPPSQRWMHAYTYSGHPTCCAVALENIAVLEREQLIERSAEKERLPAPPAALARIAAQRGARARSGPDRRRRGGRGQIDQAALPRDRQRHRAVDRSDAGAGTLHTSSDGLHLPGAAVGDRRRTNRCQRRSCRRRDSGGGDSGGSR
jgi:adenosylmethionine-8-amino-7-oxononanoate aminotransferase